MRPVLFNLPTYLVALAVLLLLLFLTFINRAAYFDEAWFAEQSLWFSRLGRVRSELFQGYHRWEVGLYVYHKLFIWVNALVTALVGFSVAGSKLVSIFFGLFCGVLIWFHGKTKGMEQQFLLVFLYFGCGTLMRYTSVSRPEVMCMTLGFASYLALDPPGGLAGPGPY